MSLPLLPYRACRCCSLSTMDSAAVSSAACRCCLTVHYASGLICIPRILPLLIPQHVVASIPVHLAAVDHVRTGHAAANDSIPRNCCLIPYHVTAVGSVSVPWASIPSVGGSPAPTETVGTGSPFGECHLSLSFTYFVDT